MKQVRTLSTSGSSNASRRAAANWSAVASEGSETGPCEISRSQLSAACAVSAPSASELPTTATRCPAGSGWWITNCATSNSWWTFSTRMTPACRSIAPNAPDGTWVWRTRWPGGAPYAETPEETAITGFRWARPRAIRENLRGLPIDSR